MAVCRRQPQLRKALVAKSLALRERDLSARGTLRVKSLRPGRSDYIFGLQEHGWNWRDSVYGDPGLELIAASGRARWRYRQTKGPS